VRLNGCIFQECSYSLHAASENRMQELASCRHCTSEFHSLVCFPVIVTESNVFLTFRSYKILVVRQLISRLNPIINVCRCDYVFSRLCSVNLCRSFSLQPSNLVT